MSRTVILVVCSLWCFGIGYYSGTRKVHTYEAQREQLFVDLVHTRKVAVTCHKILADHWSKNHQVVPGSKEIVVASEDILNILRKE